MAMLIECNSCQKTFVVPDNAITSGGRLVQCSSCGNKWTQHPINKITNVKKIDKKQEVKKYVPIKKKKQKNISKKKISTYSPEYLQKKHGIRIIDPSSLQNIGNKKIISKQNYSFFGFYDYLIKIIVVILFLFGTLNLTKEMLIVNYPILDGYIKNLYETLNNIKLIVSDFII